MILLARQLFGWPAYLFFNVSGQPAYPKWTNRASPPPFRNSSDR